MHSNLSRQIWPLLLALCGAFTALTAQSTTGCCTLEDSLARVVRMEASYLARDAVYAQQGPSLDSIELPQELVNTYYEAICAVRSKGSVITDSLFTTLGFAYHPHTLSDVVEIGVDKNEAWYQKLRDSIYPTGYAPVDSLINAYDLEVTNIFEFDNPGSNHYLFFESGRYLNTQALSRAFESLDGVRYASPGGTAGDGDRLEGAIFPEYTSLLFSIGSGDCPSGCTERSFYEFRVYPDCRVEFVGRNSSITSVADWEAFQLQVYPNPFRNSFTVDLGSERTAQYTVYNSAGQLISSGTVSGNESITLPTDQAGVYLLRLRGHQVNYVRMLIRQ